MPQKSPLRLNGQYFKYLDDIKVPKLGLATSNSWTDNFDKAFGEALRKDTPMHVHHAVPRAIRTKFPSLGQSIPEKAIHSIENLRGIPLSAKSPLDPTKSLHQHITNQWSDFYKGFTISKPPSSSDYFAFARKMDDQFGSFFIPPVR